MASANSADGHRCCLVDCKLDDKNIPEGFPRIEVATVLPSNYDKADKTKFLINWSNDGEAVLHVTCWEDILKNARVRSAKNANIKFKNASEKLMVKEAAKTEERHDGKALIETEGRRIVEMIRSAECCVAFTGAGISTSAGIGDYRGKSGKWTQDDRAMLALNHVDVVGEPEAKKSRPDDTDLQSIESAESGSETEEEDGGVAYELLRPTYTHEALYHLMELGHLKYIISQNGDGLHTLSGVPESKISDLHGNVFKERCEKCRTMYDHPCYVLDDVASQYYEEIADNGQTDVIKPRHAKCCNMCGLSHRTGRKCTNKGCKGFLMDTIINFHDNLDEAILDRATTYAKRSDLMLCLGTTLRVTPACDLVEMGQIPLRLVICNRQKTPLDSLCLQVDRNTRETRGSRVHGDCDLLMREVMKGMLSQEALHRWERGRDTRMRAYNKLRKT